MRALVVGGTGPTGPAVIEGLAARGYDVTMFHTGRHEIEMPVPVRHIHGNPHDSSSIASCLDGEHFDVVVVQYGKLRGFVDHFRDADTHVVGAGSLSRYLAGSSSPAWGALGRPAIIGHETHRLEDGKHGDKLATRIAETFAAMTGADGRARMTYLGYPLVYGPRQIVPFEWSIVRRIRDGRRRFVLPDGGSRLRSRGYALNVAQASLAVLDKPELSAGRFYAVSDEHTYSLRQWVRGIARIMDVDVELLDLPFDLAGPSRGFNEGEREHRVRSSEVIRSELGFTDAVAASEGLAATVRHLLECSPEAGGVEETNLGDRFDYALEDEYLAFADRMAGLAPQTHELLMPMASYKK